MNKLEMIFQKMETLNKEEAGKVAGGMVVISSIPDDVECNAVSKNTATTGKGTDRQVSNTGFLCGLTVNLCSK